MHSLTLSSHRYLVLPFYEWTLKSYFAPIIQARVDGGSRLMEEREVLLLLLQLCNALVHLQRNHVVHRDMKVGWLVCYHPPLVLMTFASLADGQCVH